jgi:uncharacterized membrane protein
MRWHHQSAHHEPPLLAIEPRSGIIWNEMKALNHKAEVEMVFASGAFRVSVRPAPHWLLLLAETAFLTLSAFMTFRSWHGTPWVGWTVIGILALSTAVVWLKVFFGSQEEIEFDAQHLRIRRETLGWNRTSEYPIERCSDLEILTNSEGPESLQCRFGWRTLQFGSYLSEEQAEKVIAALQDALPHVAQKLLPSLDITQHWTTLGVTDAQ